MKIGLLTTYSFNYGSYFQAIALQKKLQEMGHECELINEQIKKYKWLNLFVMYSVDPLLPKVLKNIVAAKVPQYNSYLKIKADANKVQCSPRRMRNFSTLSKQYDCIIVGSDELWSSDKSSIRFVPEYFGYGCNCPVFSYATCAIKFDVDNEELVRKARIGLKSFESIAVRDDISKEKIEKVMPDVKIEKVLDPTLLNPFFAYHGTSHKHEKYVLLYGQHYDEVQMDFIRGVAKDKKCKIYSVGWKQEWSDAFINTNSGEELQKVFAEAEFCFPSTFHGTIFSIVNHKQFISMLNPLRGKKVELLLQDLGLQNRIYEKGLHLTEISEIDYQIVEKKLDKLRGASEEYLIQGLERVRKN